MPAYRFELRPFLRACLAGLVVAAAVVAPDQGRTQQVVQKAAGEHLVVAPRVALPDGRWLEVGGGVEPGRGAALVSTDGQRLALPRGLAQPRRGHTLVLLADGRVLVLGGAGAGGLPVAVAEVFDTAAMSFSSLPATGLTARVDAAAALLPDGRVLVSGGTNGRGNVLADAEIWDPSTNTVQRSALRNPTAGIGQSATLLPTGDVLIQAGTGSTAQAAAAQLYDSHQQRFVALSPAQAGSAQQSLDGSPAPALQASIPAPEAKDVNGDEPLSLSFNKRLSVASLNAQSVTLIGPNGTESVKVVAVEQGVMAWVWPAKALLPSSRYTLFINGAVDARGLRLPLTAIGFDTRAIGGGAPAPQVVVGQADQGSPIGTRKTYAPLLSEAELAALKADDEMFVPEARHYTGGWVSGKAALARLNPPRREAARQAIYGRQEHFERMLEAKAVEHGIGIKALKAGLEIPANEIHNAPESTKKILRQVQLTWSEVIRPLPTSSPDESCSPCLAGQLLRLNGKPLANVTLRIGNHAVLTDSNGEFLVRGNKAGRQLLEIDGLTANRPDAQYGQYSYQVNLEAGKLTALPFVVWMPKLDIAHAIRLDSPTKATTVISHPLLPGLTITLPPGTVVRDAAGKIVTQVSITPVPADQATLQIPYVGVTAFYTLQPAGAIFVGIDGKPRAAEVQYPNYTRFGPGAAFRLFDYDAKGRGWYLYGSARVSASQPARLESSTPFSLYGIQPASGVAGGPPPPPPPPPCDGGNPPPGGGKGGGTNSSDAGRGYCAAGGDPVGLLSGEFTQLERDLYIDDVVPLDVTRTIRSRDAQSYTFGTGGTHRYETRIVDAPADRDPDTDEIIRTNVYVVMPNGRAVLFHGERNALFQPYTNADAMGEFRNARIEANLGDWVLYFRDGRKWTFTNISGKLIAMDDAEGRRVSVVLDSASRVGRVVSPNGRWIEFSYNASGFISQIEDNAGRTFLYGYDGPRLQTVTNAANKTHSYVWDAAKNRILKVLDASGVAQTTNEYDPVTGWVKTQTLADNSTFTFTPTIDAKTGLATQVDITDRRGKVRRVTVGPEGFVTKSVFPLADVDEQTTRYEYLNGQMSAMVDALNRRTEYTYDGNGNLQTVKRLADTLHPVSTTTVWDPVFNKPRTYTDANQHTITLDYYANGQLKSVTDHLNHKLVQLEYDAVTFQLSKLTNALDKSTTLNYTGGDVTSVLDALQRPTAFGRDPVGRAWSITDALGNSTYLDWSVLNQLKTTTDPMNGVTEFVYDDNGFNTQQIDPKRNPPRLFTPTPIGTLDTMTDAMGKAETRLYEPGGKLRQLIDRNGQLSAVTYDSLGRVKVVSFGATAAAPTAYRSQVELTWDKGNRLRVIEDRSCGSPLTKLNCSKIISKRVIKRTYNTLDQLEQEVTPQGEVNYTYDDGDRRQTMQVRNGAPGSQVDQPLITYTWDEADRLRQIEQAAGPANGTVRQIIKLDPDAAGRRQKTTLANGASINYTWDDADQLQAIVFKKADDSVIGNLTYDYDAAGRRTGVGGSLARVNLLAADVTGAKYDANNRLTKWGPATFQYDFNGNLQSDGTLTYSWDERNQLKGISNGATEQAGFQYDAVGRRYGKTIGGATTGYLYDGNNFVQELQGTSNIDAVKAQLITAGIDEVFLREEGGVLASLLTDGNNNTVRLINAAQDKIVDYTYDPYGVTTADASNGNSQQFTGRENDNPGNAQGLYYYRARYYMPGCMRFISEDPIGWASGQPNNYQYVGGDPVSFTDPNGEAIHILLGGVIGAIAGAVGAANGCASAGDIALAGALGFLTGAATAAVPVGGALVGAIARNALAGGLANSAGQLITGGPSNYSVGQAMTQAAIGGVAGGLANMAGLGAALSLVRQQSGWTVAEAVARSDGVGTTVGIAAGAGMNLGVPVSGGGTGVGRGGNCGN